MSDQAKPAMSFGGIFNMCFGFLGIQFGWGLQMANMSPIFEKLGAQNIAMLWLAAPLTGLIVQPIIGYLSDRTWHPTFGRRRPYFFIGAVLSSIALIAMPNSSTVWMAAGLLWILDASINISMEPFRAFVADKLPENQRTLGFTTQSFFIGVGSVLASLLPFVLTNVFGLANEADGNAIATSVKISFYVGAAAFFGAVLYTILTTKEYPPASIPHKEKVLESNKGFGSGFKEITESIGNLPSIMKQLAPVQFFTWVGLFCMWIFFGVTISRSVFGYQDKPALETLQVTMSQALANNQAMQLTNGDATALTKLKKEINAYYNGSTDKLPNTITINPLATNLDSTNKNFSDVTKNIEKYNANNNTTKQDLVSLAATISTIDFASTLNAHRVNRKANADAGDWVGVCFGFYSLITFCVAFLLPKLANRIGKKRTHFVSLTLGGLGLLSVWFIHNKYGLLVSMAGIGVAWASILSMPYAMLSNKLPQDKIGVYMGIFNFFIVIPEIVSALSFDYILEHVFDMNRVLFVATGGVLMLLAALLCLRVKDSD